LNVSSMFAFVSLFYSYYVRVCRSPLLLKCEGLYISFTLNMSEFVSPFTLNVF